MTASPAFPERPPARDHRGGTPLLVLASASPARLRLLSDAGLAPLVEVSGVDEGVAEPLAPAELAGHLALRKAEAVAARRRSRPDAQAALVLGCDSVLELDGRALGKPSDAAEATRRWKAMRGRAAALHTGHCLIDTATAAMAEEVVTTTVRFAQPNDEEIAAYVESGEPLEVAGAFTLLGRSAPFVEGITGDPGNVIGVSLPCLRRLIGRLGAELSDLWS